jgi:serine/threonine-protein kinase
MAFSMEQQAELVGKTIGKYKLVKPISEYGLGAAYEAVHVSLGKSCLVKFVPDEMRRDRGAVEAFRTISAQIAKINHPSIPIIHDIFYEPPSIGYVIPFAPGIPLSRRVAQGRVSTHDFARIFSAVIRALQALHKAGIAHRGIRPEGIILASEGTLHLIDAGIQFDARQLKGETALAVARSASPEEAIRAAVDPRSDAYSLGAAMYFTLTGRPVFSDSDPAAVLSAHVRKKPSRPSELRSDLPAAYDKLVLQLLEKQPEQRADLSHALSLLDPHSAPVTAAPPTTRKPGPVPAKRASTLQPPAEPPKKIPKPVLFAGGGALAGLVVVAAVILLLGKPVNVPPPNPSPVVKKDPEPAAPTANDETYFQDSLAKAKDYKAKNKLQEALSEAEQAQRFKDTPEVKGLIADIKQEIIQTERTERARPQYEKIKTMAEKKDDPVSLCFECEEFLRLNSDLKYGDEVKAIYAEAKKQVEEKQAKGPITKLPPTPVKPRPGQPPQPGPRPPQPPPPPPVTLGPEFDAAKNLVVEKKFPEAKKALLDLLKKETNANNRHAIGQELYKASMGETSRWQSQFNGKDLDASFNVVRLSDSDLSIAKDAPEITGWARQKDVAMLQLKNFKGGTGITVECFIESKFEDVHNVAIRMDFLAGNAYKDFYLSERKAALKKIFKKEDTELGAVPAQGIFKRWIRLTVVAEGDMVIGFANDYLVFALPASDVKLGEDIRILITGCSARLRDIQARF